MKFSTSATLFAIAITGGAAFAPPSPSFGRTATASTKVQETVQVSVEAESPQIEIVEVEADKEDYEGPVTAEYINAQLEKQLAKLRLKDQTSKQLEKEVRSFDNKKLSICVPFRYVCCHGERDFDQLK